MCVCICVYVCACVCLCTQQGPTHTHLHHDGHLALPSSLSTQSPAGSTRYLCSCSRSHDICAKVCPLTGLAWKRIAQGSIWGHAHAGRRSAGVVGTDPTSIIPIVPCLLRIQTSSGHVMTRLHELQGMCVGALALNYNLLWDSLVGVPTKSSCEHFVLVLS